MLYQLFIVLIAAGAVHAQMLGYVRIDNIAEQCTDSP